MTADAEFSRCIAACEAHLEDLRIARAPLRSLTRAEMRRTVARLRPWQRELESEIHGLLFFETLG